MENSDDLKEIIKKSFKNLKENFYKNYKIEEREEDTYPPFLVKRDIIESLPPTLRIIELFGPKNHKILKNGKGFIIKFEFDKLNSDKVEYCGSVDYTQPELLVSLLVHKFGLQEEKIKNYASDICKNFQITGMWEPDETWYLHFIQDDIIKNPKAFDESLRHIFFMFPDVPILSEKFEKPFHENYNLLYNLPTDPILSQKELIKADSRSSTFNLNLEILQKRIADIQLIPSVPDEIRTVFNRAKDLFIFGYFRYEFFTISQHYAFLAFESATKTRYIKSLGEEITLTDKKDKNLNKKLIAPTFHFIESFCWKNKGWNVRTLLVNNKPFPYNGKKVLDWLENNQLIRRWEKGSYNAGMFLRHSYSHLERPQVTMPDSTTLKRVAEQINYLFHSSN